jgi:hypothetical protein
MAFCISLFEGDKKSTSVSPPTTCRERGSSLRAKRIRDVRRLVAQYGGRASKWVKKSSPRFESDKEYFEIHWYEHPGMGRFEVKRVRVKRL